MRWLVSCPCSNDKRRSVHNRILFSKMTCLTAGPGLGLGGVLVVLVVYFLAVGLVNWGPDLTAWESVEHL